MPAAQVLGYQFGGIAGPHVAVHGAFGVHDEGRTGAFFAVATQVQAVAGLHLGVLLVAVYHLLFQALVLELFFQRLGHVLPHPGLLVGANE